MRGYLLDTCAWIDSLLAPEKLRPPVRKIIGGGTPLHLCSVSLLEFARKEARGEISLSMPCVEWFERIALPKGKIILLDVIPPDRGRCHPFTPAIFEPAGKRPQGSHGSRHRRHRPAPRSHSSHVGSGATRL